MMQLQDYYFIAEIVAAFAVVGSLIFVGLQLRHSAKATRMSNAQEATREWNALSLLHSTDDHLLEAQAKFHRPDMAAVLVRDDPLKMRYRYFVTASSKVFENNFQQWQAGNLPDEVWQGFRASLVDMLCHNMAWEIHFTEFRRYHSPDFLAYVDSLRPEAEKRRADIIANGNWA